MTPTATVFAAFDIKGSLLLGILVAVVCGIPLGVTQAPAGVLSIPDFSSFGGNPDVEWYDEARDQAIWTVMDWMLEDYPY